MLVRSELVSQKYEYLPKSSQFFTFFYHFSRFDNSIHQIAFISYHFVNARVVSKKMSYFVFMAYIGLLSDTHGIFDPKVRAFLEPVDEIWHAGDFGSPAVVDTLTAFKPLRGVYGNCDGQETRLMVPYMQHFHCEGLDVLMMHIGGYPGRYDPRALNLITAHQPNVFVCGHSHILRVMNDKRLQMMVLNPGAAGVQGIHQVRTALRFRIESGRFTDMEVGEWDKHITPITPQPE